MFYLELHHDIAVFIGGMQIRQIIYFSTLFLRSSFYVYYSFM